MADGARARRYTLGGTSRTRLWVAPPGRDDLSCHVRVTGATIISATYVSTRPNTSMTFQLHL